MVKGQHRQTRTVALLHLAPQIATTVTAIGRSSIGASLKCGHSSHATWNHSHIPTYLYASLQISTLPSLLDPSISLIPHSTHLGTRTTINSARPLFLINARADLNPKRGSSPHTAGPPTTTHSHPDASGHSYKPISNQSPSVLPSLSPAPFLQGSFIIHKTMF